MAELKRKCLTSWLDKWTRSRISWQIHPRFLGLDLQSRLSMHRPLSNSASSSYQPELHIDDGTDFHEGKCTERGMGQPENQLRKNIDVSERVTRLGSFQFKLNKGLRIE